MKSKNKYLYAVSVESSSKNYFDKLFGFLQLDLAVFLTVADVLIKQNKTVVSILVFFFILVCFVFGL